MATAGSDERDDAASAGTPGPDKAVLLSRLERIVSAQPKNSFSTTGAVFAVADRTGAQAIVALGEDASGRPLATDSLMPIASASKLASGLLILRLVGLGLVALDAELATYLPQARAARTPGVTIRRLLCHTSGLPLEIAHDLSSEPGQVRYAPGLRWPGAMADACLATELATPPGTAVQYSNVAYGLLGLVAEQVGGAPYARLLERHVFEPLKIEAYTDTLPDKPIVKVADVPSPYAGTDLSPYNSSTALLLGVPWGNVATTAAGLLALVRSYSAQSVLLSPDTARLAQADQTDGLSGGFGTTDAFLGHSPSRRITWSHCPWGLSIELQGGKEPHWAPASLPQSFGQIGSSGCLAWHDPASGVSWAMLGARTTEGGWLLRHGARIAQSALAACAEPQPVSA